MHDTRVTEGSESAIKNFVYVRASKISMYRPNVKIKVPGSLDKIIHVQLTCVTQGSQSCYFWSFLYGVERQLSHVVWHISNGSTLSL